MRRCASALARLVLGAAAMCTVTGLTAPAALAAATPAAPPTPGCVVAITDFSFHPDVVPPGTPTTLNLAARNCTGTTLKTTLTQYGHEPPGCPVIDPIAMPVVFAPHGIFARSTSLIAPRCMGVEEMTATFTDAQGHLLAKATARLTVLLAAATASVRN